MDPNDIKWNRLRLAAEILVGLLAWYLIWILYPLQNVLPIYGKY